MQDYRLMSIRISPGFWLQLHAGLRWDQLWLIVNSKGRMYTQRVEPKLALIEVALPVEVLSPGWEPDKSSFLGEGV